ncbi:MAG: hypothetical protein Kow0074_04170 [Candidatus Zixiibacteriota bacterium]
MTQDKAPIEQLLTSLNERAKELNCIYAIEEILSDPDADHESICRRVVEAIPPGWQYPDVCRARIELYGDRYVSTGFEESPYCQHADIVVQGQKAGRLSVFYIEETPHGPEGPFLPEENRLIASIADRLGHYFTYQQLRRLASEVNAARKDLQSGRKGEWRVILDLLRQTDPDLFTRISHKMLNHLCYSGVPGSQRLLRLYHPDMPSAEEEANSDPNRPHRRATSKVTADASGDVFALAAEHLPDEEILSHVQRWIQEDKLSFLALVVDRHVPLVQAADAIRRYHLLAPKHLTSAQSPAMRGIEVALTRRFLSDQLDYINSAKKFINLEDFYQLLDHLIYSNESHGRLGGKSAGMYLASKILQKSEDPDGLLQSVRIPKTWYITSDIILNVMHFNDLDDVVEQKYKPIEQVRQEYPHIVQMFKRSHFPPEITKALSVALDDFGDNPIIVRSSSLLEDRMGAAFSGKYKSLFLANQGSKEQRLEALCDAISEVYASTFGPDPIEYRAERGLIDFGEEMGIMIQEVVGSRIGRYFLPSFAGVAFSRNEFRWSPRIKRDDGLVRLVPGLGTRAVDRLSDDYPVLIAPGQPSLRVNPTVEETLRYAPRYIDVINLETNQFETVTVKELLSKHGDDIPGVRRMISVLRDGQMLQKPGFDTDFSSDDVVVTFHGLINETPFVRQVKFILELLEANLKTPVDIEFAHDGEHFYLLQCRPQSHADVYAPAPIPKNVPEDRLLFTANRYISNGRASDITHIVYIDAARYAELPERADLLTIGKAVGRLNDILPKRRFILIGPGRWGSRGDIKLGVSVTYSEINNTAALIEVARQTGNYVPDLSFGTHFFQDLVEARILYLPLYPDDDGVVFNEDFFLKSRNILGDVLPEYSHLANTIRLIDIPQTTNGLCMRLLMNADLEEAVGILAEPQQHELPAFEPPEEDIQTPPDTHWRWRMQMCQRIAEQIDPERFGVVALYVIGSTKNANAGPASDIDLLIHIRGSDRQREELDLWLKGWSLCLDEMNYLQTGYRSDGLLDVHYITDEDIEKRTSYAVKIGAVTDAARPLKIGRS